VRYCIPNSPIYLLRRRPSRANLFCEPTYIMPKITSIDVKNNSVGIVQNSSFVSYAYTVKYLGKQLTMQEAGYDAFFHNLQECFVEIKYKIGERDSKGRLHYHGIILVEKNLYMKRLCLQGYHTRFDEVYDESGWLTYIHKDCEYAYLIEEGKERDAIDPDSPTLVPLKKLF